MKTYLSCRDGMCGATDCPSCSPHYFRAGVHIYDLEENQPAETFEEALLEWKTAQRERGHSFKARDIDELLTRNPLAEFKENE